MIEPLSADARPADTLPGPLVPESRAPTAGRPVTASGLHWLLALPAAPLVWFFPRWIGPNLAASTWRSAYAAHLFGLLFAMGFTMGQLIGARDPRSAALFGSLSPIEELRRAAAAVVVLFQGFVGEARRNPADAVAICLGVLIGHAAIWIAATAFLPFFAAGERRLALYLRTVKLLLWSTLLLIPLGMLSPRVIVYMESRDMPFTAFAMLLLWALWSLSVIVRLGARYPGPAEGPRWDDMPISCESCGYTLANQPLIGRCPECASSVESSLPERRARTRLATASFGAYVPAFFATWRAAAFRRDFAKQIRVWSDERAARRFAVGVATLVGLIVGFGGLILGSTLWSDNQLPMPGREPSHKYVEFAATGVIAFVIGFATVPAWMMLMGLIACRAGFTESLRRGIVICYASAIAPLIAVLGVFGTLTSYWVSTWYRPRPSAIYIPEFGAIDKVAIVACILHAPVAIGLLLSLLRTRRMLRETRYANA